MVYWRYGIRFGTLNMKTLLKRFALVAGVVVVLPFVICFTFLQPGVMVV